MTLRRFLTGTCLVAALSFGVAACGDDDEESAGGGGGGEANTASFDLQIGALIPLTGDLSIFGPAGRAAAELAAAQASAAAQEAGADINVTLEVADTETNEQASQQAARQLVSGGATCLTGDWASSGTIATGTSVAARQRVPLISPASTSAEITTLEDNGFVYRTAPSDNLQAVALADAIEQELGGTDQTISLAARNDAYGEGFIGSFQEAWEERGGQTTGPVLYDPEQASYDSEAGEITSGNPDAYVIIDFPETYAKMGAALVRTGNFDASTMFTADGLAADSIPEGVPAESLEGARGTRPAAPTDTEGAKAFDTLFSRENPDVERGTFDAQNFDAVLACFLGAVAAGSNEGTSIQENLQRISAPEGEKYTFETLAEAVTALREGEDIDFDGVTGPIDWDDNGDPTTATYDIYQYTGGDLEVTDQIEAADEEAAPAE